MRAYIKKKGLQRPAVGKPLFMMEAYEDLGRILAIRRRHLEQSSKM